MLAVSLVAHQLPPLRRLVQSPCHRHTTGGMGERQSPVLGTTGEAAWHRLSAFLAVIRSERPSRMIWLPHV